MKTLSVTRELIAHYSQSEVMFVHQEVKRKNLDALDLGDIAVWLAEHGTPEIRARMARRLVPVVLGLVQRSSADSDRLLSKVEDMDLARMIVNTAAKPRKERAAKIAKHRPGKKKPMAVPPDRPITRYV